MFVGRAAVWACAWVRRASSRLPCACHGCSASPCAWACQITCVGWGEGGGGRAPGSFQGGSPGACRVLGHFHEHGGRVGVPAGARGRAAMLVPAACASQWQCHGDTPAPQPCPHTRGAHVMSLRPQSATGIPSASATTPSNWVGEAEWGGVGGGSWGHALCEWSYHSAWRARWQPLPPPPPHTHHPARTRVRRGIFNTKAPPAETPKA